MKYKGCPSRGDNFISLPSASNWSKTNCEVMPTKCQGPAVKKSQVGTSHQILHQSHMKIFSQGSQSLRERKPKNSLLLNVPISRSKDKTRLILIYKNRSIYSHKIQIVLAKIAWFMDFKRKSKTISKTKMNS